MHCVLTNQDVRRAASWFTCILYYTYDGAPVYFGHVGYNQNNKNILLGVIYANGAKGFSATTCVLYRASPISSADEYSITTTDAIIGSNITTIPYFLTRSIIIIII